MQNQFHKVLLILLINKNLTLNEIKLNKIKNINNKEKIILHDNDTITIQGDKNKISLVKNGLEYEKFDNGSWNVEYLPINKDRVGKNGIVGNASTATKLKTARNIGNVLFDGSVDIIPRNVLNADKLKHQEI